MNPKVETFLLSNMIKGWFVGDFEPTAFKTSHVEVGIKYYKAGDYEASHHHKIATEITVIQKGKVEMNGVFYNEGDIIKLLPGTSTDFKAVTDAAIVVVKIPGAGNDKYID